MSKNNKEIIRKALIELIEKHPDLTTQQTDKKKETKYIYSISSQTETLIFKFLSKYSLANPSFRTKHTSFAKTVSHIIIKLPEKLKHHSGIPLIYFLNKNDKEFVRYVFISILLREPYENDYQHYLNKIRTLQAKKIDIIYNVSHSEEAKKHAVKIIGLQPAYNIYSFFYFRIPIISKFIRSCDQFFIWLRFLPHLPSIAVSHGEKILDIEKQLSELHAILLESKGKSVKLETNFFELETDVFDLKENLTSFYEKQRIPNDFYLAFENNFRGSQAEIIDKLSFYKNYVDKIPTNQKKMPFLDLGCGRGEWLQLIKKWGFKAIGVDTNKEMLALSKKIGCAIVNKDALSYLQSQKSESYCGISGFHILEHVEHSDLIKIIQETSRVLSKDGVAIFETPNPENLIVGSCNFYLDLTHKQPLHPQTMEFIFKFFGFKNIELIRLHPMKSIKKSNNKEINALSHFINNFQDFAIVAYK